LIVIKVYAFLPSNSNQIIAMLRNLKNTDLNLLRVFRVVSECGGFSAAQAELNVSTSTISLQMSDLETRLGARLCNRGRAGFSLTEEGQRVLDACDQLFDDIQRFEIKVDNISGKLTGNVCLAVVEGNNSHHDFHLHKAIKRFQQRNNGAHISIQTAAANVCERLILDDQVDFGVGLFTRKMPQLDYEWLFSSRIDLYCGKESPFFDRKEEDISIDEIIAFPHVRRGYFSDVQMPKAHRPFNNQAVASSIEAMSYFLLSGEFLGFLPNHYAQQWVDKGQLRALKTAHFGYNWNFHLAWRRGREFNSTTSAFIKDVQKQAKKVEAIASAL